MLRTRSGDRPAFGQLVRKYAGVVRSLVAARVRDRTDVEDACQETFLLAFRRLDSLGDPERFAGWLSRIAVNTATGRLRKRKRDRHTSLAEFGDDAAAPEEPDRLEAGEEVDRMLEQVAQLDERTQLILTLRYQHGMAVRDIATQLGQQPPAVSMRITRALRKLRTELEGDPR